MMIEARRLNPAQIKWMLIGALLMGALCAGALVTTMASAQDAEPNGEAVYDHWCAPCHAAGPGHPGTQGLQIK
jgi:cytochrome c5